MKKRIAVIGSDDGINPDTERIAESIGVKIAENDCVLICGGRSGVMAAACRGAKQAGGITVGILPSLEGADANEWVDIGITTGIGYARNSIVVSSADVVIAICGRTGTLSEIAMAINFEKPVIAVIDSGGIAQSVAEGMFEAGLGEKIHIADSKNAVDKALSLIIQS